MNATLPVTGFSHATTARSYRDVQTNSSPGFEFSTYDAPHHLVSPDVCDGVRELGEPTSTQYRTPRRPNEATGVRGGHKDTAL